MTEGTVGQDLPRAHTSTATTPGDAQFSRYLLLKRAIDLVACILGLTLLLPFLAVLAVAIKLHSPGPVLFRQTRIGKGKNPYTFLLTEVVA